MSRIPEPTKREVRQEAGFGCCVCGFPIIDYHHIERESQDPEDIMILCPNHHREATEGAMLKKEQIYYKKNPHNIEKGFVDGKLKINQKYPVITMGSNHLIGEGDLIIVDGESLLSIYISEGRLELTMRLYDKDNKLVANIEKNEWVSGNSLPWDLESKNQWMRIRRKLRDIELEIDARKDTIRLRADIWKNGQNIQLTRDLIELNGVAIWNSSVSNLGFVAAYFDIDTFHKTSEIKINPRFPKAIMISEPDIKKRIKIGLRRWDLFLWQEELRKIKSCDHDFIIEDRGIDHLIHNVCKKCGLVRVTNRKESK